MLLTIPENEKLVTRSALLSTDIENIKTVSNSFEMPSIVLDIYFHCRSAACTGTMQVIRDRLSKEKRLFDYAVPKRNSAQMSSNIRVFARSSLCLSRSCRFHHASIDSFVTRVFPSTCVECQV